MTARRLVAHAALALLLVAGVAGTRTALAKPATASSGEVATRFYDAFVKGDVTTMESLYAPDVKFRDEIFTFKDRDGVMGMWRLLVDPKGGAKFTYKVLSVEGETARVEWIADYKFPSEKFGRKVHNVITATLTIKDGKIVNHVDSFSWEKWSRQALPFGKLSTWKPAENLIKWTLRTVLAWRAKTPPAKAPVPTSKGMVNELQRVK
jgi:ketosteroid isomerase-like protein